MMFKLTLLFQKFENNQFLYCLSNLLTNVSITIEIIKRTFCLKSSKYFMNHINLNKIKNKFMKCGIFFAISISLKLHY